MNSKTQQKRKKEYLEVWETPIQQVSDIAEGWELQLFCLFLLWHFGGFKRRNRSGRPIKSSILLVPSQVNLSVSFRYGEIKNRNRSIGEWIPLSIPNTSNMIPRLKTDEEQAYFLSVLQEMGLPIPAVNSKSSFIVCQNLVILLLNSSGTIFDY